MLCPSCNKFAAYDTSAEPEIELDAFAEVEKGVMESVSVTGTVRIVLTAECCGDELKEANFDIEESVDVEKHADCTCEDWTESVEAEGSGELTERQDSTVTKIAKRGPDKGKEVIKPIPARYQKRYFGADVQIVITCGCGKEIGSSSRHDELQASAMDEMV